MSREKHMTRREALRKMGGATAGGMGLPIAAAKAEPAVAEAIAGKTIAKEIYVKGKLVNIAVKG